MSIYHLLNAMHSYLKTTNVFVAIFLAATCTVYAQWTNVSVVIELLLRLLIWCVLIELLCGYWTDKKENWTVSVIHATNILSSQVAASGSPRMPSAPIGRDENFVYFEFLEGQFYKEKPLFVNLEKTKHSSEVSFPIRLF